MGWCSGTRWSCCVLRGAELDADGHMRHHEQSEQRFLCLLSALGRDVSADCNDADISWKTVLLRRCKLQQRLETWTYDRQMIAIKRDAQNVAVLGLHIPIGVPICRYRYRTAESTCTATA